ncbi:LRR receptor-like serine/threonine-protein kinase FLS2 [Senna tora]|uniref:LRR receptor-like serine/threonine-protein kinase FLS2 n=1 Tax=Senna tora TaxID=362788 RepID=A0A834SJK8_9FABA|nr:LRR receptor-like serine/threonine-protein kinase FLS2 [Senna tora]
MKMGWVGMVVLISAIVVMRKSMGWLEDEKRALVDIKHSLFVQNASLGHPLLPSWDVSDPKSDSCKWEGVLCHSSSGHLITLSLSNLPAATYEYGFYLTSCPDSMTISLNMSLFLPFHHLTTLNLSINCFHHLFAIQDGRSNTTLFPMLETLDVSHNHELEESGIINFLSALTSLKSLNLAYCNIRGPFIIQDGRSNSTILLETLDLSGNRELNGSSTIKFLSGLTSLRNLYLANSDIRESFFIQDGRSNSTIFPMLDTLDLNENRELNGSSTIKFLSGLTSLRILYLANSDIRGSFFIQDGRSNSTIFPMLETLDLSGNRELNESSIIKFLSALTSLRNLNLARCDISGPFSLQDDESNSTLSESMLETLDLTSNYRLNESIIKLLTAFTSLKNLNLCQCNISGPFPIQVLQNLEVLDLSFNSLSSPSSTVQDIYSMPKLAKLRTLELSSNRLEKNIFKYLVALPALKFMFLTHNYLEEDGLLNDKGLCKMMQLQMLDLSHNHLSGRIDPCLGNLTSLQALDLSHNSLSGSIPPSLFALPSLEYLSLSHNNFEGLSSMNSLANNSKLKVLSLGDRLDNHNTKTFRVETENLPWIPSFQLEYLHMSSCLSSRTIPTFLLYQHGLKYVDLSNNNLVGIFPFWLLVNNSRPLTNVFLNGNSFNELQLPSDLNQPLDQVLLLNLSHNNFQGNLPINIGHFLSHLEYLDISSNMFDGHIPTSIGEMSNLKVLDLSYNKFSGKIPRDVLLGCTSLEYLGLSNNNLHGNIFPTPVNFGSLGVFLADNNQFNETLEDEVSFGGHFDIVDISNNNLSGKLPNWIFKSTMWISVSSNNFEGTIPPDFCKSDDLYFLDLSHNRFFGEIPSCLFNSTSLRMLNLRSNNLTGIMPEVLSRSSLLKTIDLSNNKIFGTIPESFYRLSYLTILSLAKNELEGQLSRQMCQLQRINILDLSHNKFTGSIPSCFNNMSFGNYSLYFLFWRSLSLASSANSYYPPFQSDNQNVEFYGQAEVQVVTKSLSYLYKGDITKNMSGLDLSCNQLTGEIPQQIGDLHALHALNLSHNHLNGTIPESFRKMIQMESLDLSSNNLIGGIPMQLQDLTFLSTFNVCYNNLSGRAPDQGQFANFDESNYKGNPYLSWSDSNRRKETPSETPLKNSTEGSECFIDLTAFYWSFGASYVMVILTLVTILWINPRWRNVWFYYISICLQKSLGRFFDDAFFYHD